jgi:hypothetical protein
MSMAGVSLIRIRGGTAAATGSTSAIPQTRAGRLWRFFLAVLTLRRRIAQQVPDHETPAFACFAPSV